MPKPPLKPKWTELEHQIIETLLAGHKEWRPDLAYPESYSDMQDAVRGLLRMFEVKHRALPIGIKELLLPDCHCPVIIDGQHEIRCEYAKFLLENRRE